jgi:hypothetical protein
VTTPVNDEHESSPTGARPPSADDVDAILASLGVISDSRVGILMVGAFLAMGALYQLTGSTFVAGIVGLTMLLLAGMLGARAMIRDRRRLQKLRNDRVESTSAGRFGGNHRALVGWVGLAMLVGTLGMALALIFVLGHLGIRSS